jgi:hypothetical protein
MLYAMVHYIKELLMFNLLTMLLLAQPDMPLQVAKLKGYCSRYKYHDSFNNQDVIVRLYYDLSVNPAAAAQINSIVQDVDAVTLAELQDVMSVVSGVTMTAQVTQL